MNREFRYCSYGFRVSGRRRCISIMLVSGALLATAFQYLPFYFQQYFLFRNSIYWTLSNEQFSTVGIVRYVKDGYLLFFGITWPLLCYLWADVANQKKLFLWIGILMGIISFGLIGVISNPSVYMLLAGLRWVLLLHAAVGIWFILRCSYKDSMEWARSIGKIILLVLFVSVFFGIISYFISGGIWIPGIRVTGIYASAPVFGEMMVAIALFLFVLQIRRSWVINNILYFITFIGAALPGSRSSMVIVILIWIPSILAGLGKKLRINPIWFLLPLFVLGVLAVNVASQIANRGNLYDNFSGRKDTRLYYFSNAIKHISNFNFVTASFGKGLGYGTNSYSILNRGISRDAIHGSMDNTLIPVISQFGFIGGIVFMLFAFIFVLSLIKKYRMQGIIISVSLIILSITQNIFEMYPIMLIIPLVMLLMQQGKKKKCQFRPIKIGYSDMVKG